MLNIIPIAALQTNYIWLLVNPYSKHCIIVDPGEAAPVMNVLQEQQLKPVAIFLTHHHQDHIGGVADLLNQHSSIIVFGPAIEKIATVNHPLHGGEILSIKELDMSLQVLSIPGHTRGHLAFYLLAATATPVTPPLRHASKVPTATTQFSDVRSAHRKVTGHLFCGDTLFTGGCGRVFEGTPAQMYDSLCRLAALPETTLIYCGHEYTEANLHFAQTIEPNNRMLAHRIKETRKLRTLNLPTVPSSLALEKHTNPFLRCEENIIIAMARACSNTEVKHPAEVFAILRHQKDLFKNI